MVPYPIEEFQVHSHSYLSKMASDSFTTCPRRITNYHLSLGTY